MAYGESIGHMIDDVTWPWKVKVGRSPKMSGAHYLENGWRYSVGYNRAPIGNGIGLWGIKWLHDRWRRWSVNLDLGMFGREIGSLEKSHGIGQTPCSYEHYLGIKTNGATKYTAPVKHRTWSRTDQITQSHKGLENAQMHTKDLVFYFPSPRLDQSFFRSYIFRVLLFYVRLFSGPAASAEPSSG